MWEVIVSNVSEVFVRVLYRERFDHVCDGRGAGSNVGIPALNVSNTSVCLLFVNARGGDIKLEYPHSCQHTR